jgi:hypothetical protein
LIAPGRPAATTTTYQIIRRKKEEGGAGCWLLQLRKLR